MIELQRLCTWRIVVIASGPGAATLAVGKSFGLVPSWGPAKTRPFNNLSARELFAVDQLGILANALKMISRCAGGEIANVDQHRRVHRAIRCDARWKIKTRLPGQRTLRIRFPDRALSDPGNKHDSHGLFLRLAAGEDDFYLNLDQMDADLICAMPSAGIGGAILLGMRYNKGGNISDFLFLKEIAPLVSRKYPENWQRWCSRLDSEERAFVDQCAAGPLLEAEALIEAVRAKSPRANARKIRTGRDYVEANNAA